MQKTAWVLHQREWEYHKVGMYVCKEEICFLIFIQISWGQRSGDHFENCHASQNLTLLWSESWKKPTESKKAGRLKVLNWLRAKVKTNNYQTVSGTGPITSWTLSWLLGDWHITSCKTTECCLYTSLFVRIKQMRYNVSFRGDFVIFGRSQANGFLVSSLCAKLS